MGGPQAAGVLATVKRDAMERRGEVWTEEEETAFKQPTIDMFEEQSHPLYASARLWDDGIIDPRKSRDVLALSLTASLNAPIEPTRFGVFRMQGSACGGGGPPEVFRARRKDGRKRGRRRCLTRS